MGMDTRGLFAFIFPGRIVLKAAEDEAKTGEPVALRRVAKFTSHPAVTSAGRLKGEVLPSAHARSGFRSAQRKDVEQNVQPEL